jgi:hypothetical protein
MRVEGGRKVRRTAARPAGDAGDNAKLSAALAQERLVTLELQRAILPFA